MYRIKKKSTTLNIFKKVKKTIDLAVYGARILQRGNDIKAHLRIPHYMTIKNSFLKSTHFRGMLKASITERLKK